MLREEFNEARVYWSISIGLANASCKASLKLSTYISYDAWMALSEQEQGDFLQTTANDWSMDYIEVVGTLEEQ